MTNRIYVVLLICLLYTNSFADNNLSIEQNSSKDVTNNFLVYDKKIDELELKLKEYNIEINLLKKNQIKSADLNIFKNEISKITDSIKEATPNWFESLISWILQIIGITIGAFVAFVIMKNQFEESWKQIKYNQEQSQINFEKNIQESWSQLLYNLGIDEKREEEKLIRENLKSIQENQDFQKSLILSLQIYLEVIETYTHIIIENIELINEITIKDFKLPEAPAGLWENLTTYSKSSNKIMLDVITISHLYKIGEHYLDIQKNKLIQSLKLIKTAKEKDEMELKELSNKEIENFKSLMKEYFLDIQKHCNHSLRDIK